MNSIYFQYLNDIAKYPLLTREQEKVLIPLAHQGNRRAIDLLVKSNLKFVVNIANLYKGQGLDIGELINEGNMGLIEAARRFDPNQKIKFISYAVWWIRQNIIRAISEKARLVRISAEKELVLRRFNRLSTKTRQVVGGQMVIDPESLEAVTMQKKLKKFCRWAHVLLLSILLSAKMAIRLSANACRQIPKRQMRSQPRTANKLLSTIC